MSNEPIEIKIDNKDISKSLLNIAKKGEDLKPLMKNIAGLFASSTEDNFQEEGRPNKWPLLSNKTVQQRTKNKKWPGQILQLSGQLASSISTEYDENSAVIGSNKAYAAIHQIGGFAGKNKKVGIPARPYLQLTEDDFDEIFCEITKYIKE